MSLDDLELRSAALLVIDMQNAFCHPRGTLGASGVDTSRTSAIVPRLRSTIAHCRDAGMPVLWTLQEHVEPDRRRARKRLAPHTARRARVAAVAGTWDAAIVDELADLAVEPLYVVRKHRFGAFYQTRLDVLLQMLGVSTLFVTGVTTNACVETTIREAYLRDYDVVGVEDCVAGVNAAWESMALEVWRQYFAVTCSSGELLQWLERQGEPRPVRIHHLLLKVSDLERAKAFYIDLLGFEPRADAKPLPDGRPFVSLQQGLGLTAGRPAGEREVDHLAFEVRNVEALNKKLKQAGVPFERELGQGPYGRAIYVRDPDGNVLELFETA